MASRILEKGVHRITQGYKPAHKAVDLGRAHLGGEPVIAHSAGTVVFCQTGQKHNRGSTGNTSYGNCVKLRHDGGFETLYAHLASVDVALGEPVAEGQRLGLMGNTGNSTGVHLHFEVRQAGRHIDPTPYLAAPLPGAAPHLAYRVWTNRWLPYTSQPAGTPGQPLSALQVRPEAGDVFYRVHLLSGSWLPWVKNDTDWAGVRGRPIDALQMRCEGVPGVTVRYRVSPTGSDGWYAWCTGLYDPAGDGYAGVFGRPIDRVQCEFVEG